MERVRYDVFGVGKAPQPLLHGRLYAFLKRRVYILDT